MIFGPSRVGKSSLFEVLCNKACKKDSKSTGIYKVNMFKESVTKTSTDSKLSWHKIELEDEISRLRFKLEEQIRDSKQRKQPHLLQKNAEKPFEHLEVEKNICKSINQPVDEIIKISTLMVCYDSGGQAEFFDVMPLLATNPTGYIMVLDMSISLDTPIKSIANIEGKDYSSDEIPCSILMKNAIASIHSCSSYTACKNLLVVGTHLDECKNPEETIYSLDKKILECLVTDGGKNLFRERNKNNKMIKSTYIHPVSNLCKSEQLEKMSKQLENITNQSVEEIHKAIDDMSKKNRWYDEISIKSYVFLLEIQLKLKKPPHYLTANDYIKYAAKCGIDSEDIDEVLKYFHKLGFIFYFKESNNKIIADVIFSPQWVFDRLSDIIFEKYSQKSLPQINNIKRGVVKKELLSFNQAEKSIDYLFEIFQSQNIMVEFPDEKQHYFMPALLSPGLPDDKSLQDILEKKFERRIHERLYVKFDKHYFPRVVFCYLANKLISIKEWKLDYNLRYNNILVFQIPRSIQYVGLFSYNTELVVEVYVEKGIDFHTKPHVKPHEISALLFQFITECCAMIEFQDNFKFGFICSKNNCKLFAGVKLQYPYLAEKYCEKCYSTDLSSDELIWLISPEVVGVMVCMYIL